MHKGCPYPCITIAPAADGGHGHGHVWREQSMTAATMSNLRKSTEMHIRTLNREPKIGPVWWSDIEAARRERALVDGYVH